MLCQPTILKSSRPHGLVPPCLKAWMVAVILLGLPGLDITARANAQNISEHQVKAAFLVNFTKYVEWPVENFGATNTPIVITILGDPDLAAEFGKIIVGKTINGHPLILRTISSAEQFTNDCHIVFISSAARRTAQLLSQLQNASVLTVGDEDDFLDQGGAIRFARRDRKIRLEVNLTATNEAKLKISSKLLSVADAVKGTAK